jgi:hypothetical protein
MTMHRNSRHDRQRNSPITLGRRSLLRGLMYGSAVSIALPALDIMLNTNGTALADGAALPKRFGVFFWGNGVRLSQWTPTTTGPGYALTEELAPLVNVKDYVSVVSGMNIKSGNERGHHAGCVGILSGSPMISQDPQGALYASTFSAPSIDQVVASGLNSGTRFRSLEVGISRSVTTGEGTTLRYLSHNGPDNANPPEYSPRALFSRLFGPGFTAPDQTPVIDPKLALRRSVLDAVRQDVVALQQRLGKTDRERLDQHLSSIRALENQIALIEEAPPPPPACIVPDEPADVSGNSQLVAINAAMSQLLALSLACDQTRVFSVLFSGSVGGTSYPEAGVPENHHSLSHEEPGNQEKVHAVTTFIMQRFANLLESLHAVKEGDISLLDQSIVLASSDCAEGQPHSINDYPILVAGGGGGSLVHPGIHHRGAGNNTSRVLLALLQAMDLPLVEFGNGGGYSNTPAVELHA